MPYNLLSDINPSSIHWTIQVKVSRMWEFHGNTDEGPIKHLDLILLDEKNNAMYAEIPPDAISILKPKLNEGMVAVIKKFLVERAKTRFKAVDAPYMIKMNRLTNINKTGTYPPTFPEYTFRLTPFHKLNEYVNVDEKFHDVIGQVTAVSNSAVVRVSKDRHQTKRVLKLQDLSENTLDVSLWGNRALEFNGEQVYEQGQKQAVIVIFVGTLYKKYGGPPFLSCTSACRWYINKQMIPEVQRFYQQLPQPSKPIEKITLVSNATITTQVQPKTIMQLKKVDPFDQTDERYCCTVTISRLTPNQGWLYVSCRKCRSGTRLIGGTYKCNDTDCTEGDPEYRYKLCLIGTDGDGDLEFVLFGDVAQLLIGKPVIVMRNKYRSDEIPLEIQNIVGQKFTFVVRISAKKFIRNPNADPSFEVIYIAEQFGKQDLNLQINMNQPPSTSTPLQVTKDLPPLMPITDNTIGAKEDKAQDNNLEIPFDPMDIEDNQRLFDDGTGKKRAFEDIEDSPSGSTMKAKSKSSKTK
ncbi:replication factor A protein 1-like [Phragmites australis]|uniref:replication factor A protein 1-like n=1 Tax=Phragmites australis TaxID=29695 RepID=UPI002D78F0F2|nr:replication factor A protein 1-like [Phragmites australis]XP_062197982.1 replication factor A protein 1-like [Phragmites australis]